MAKYNQIPVGGEFVSVSSDGIVADAASIFDYIQMKSQEFVNIEVKQDLTNLKRSGLKSERPTENLFIGMPYMQVDVENGTFPIWVSELNDGVAVWVKADGTSAD